MTYIPDYHDALAVANLRRGQLPFYVLDLVLDAHVPLHHHDFAELFFVYDGEGEESINGTRHALKPGTVSFLLPHHLHEFRSSAARPVRMYCCMFDINVLYGSRFDFELAGRLLQTGNTLPSYVEFEGEEAERLHEVFRNIFQEYNGSHFGKSSWIRLKLLEALLTFARAQYPHAADSADAADAGTAGKKTFWDILQYVHLHYADKLTLETLSRRYNVSVPFVSQTFKRISGQGFLEYLHTLRINSALALLATTEMPVSDIAAEVGFDSYRSFVRVFKKRKGITPGEYRDSCLSASLKT